MGYTFYIEVRCEKCGTEAATKEDGWCRKCLAPLPGREREREGKKVKWLESTFEESGGPEYKIPYNIDNKKHGRAKYYYRSGKLASDKTYSNDVEHGQWIENYENGNVEAEGNKVDGELHGLVKYYYENEKGKPKEEGSYEKGSRQGLWIKKQANGKIYEESFYVDGKLHGMVKEYYLSGAIKSETPYVQGKPQGQTKWYNEDGEECFTPDPDNLWIVEEFISWLQNQDNKIKEIVPNDLVDYMRLHSPKARAALLEAAKTYRDNLRSTNIHRRMVSETLHKFLTRAGEKGIKTTIITNPDGKRIEIKTDKDGREISRAPARLSIDRPRIPDINIKTNSTSPDSTESINEKPDDDLPIDEPVKAVEESTVNKDVDDVSSSESGDSVISEEEELSYAESERREYLRRLEEARIRNEASKIGAVLLDEYEKSFNEPMRERMGPFSGLSPNPPHVTGRTPSEDNSLPPKPEPVPPSTASSDDDESVVPELTPTATIALKDEPSDKADDSLEDETKKKIV